MLYTDEASELSGELMLRSALAHRLAELDSHRSLKIVTVCKSGGRAHTAAQILMQAGFPKVHVMVGGMTGWKGAGFPTGT
ncbi:MAG: rhodanese-like domain-containing protein [Nitrospirae bacterium]|nr:rhodanese-like domain-containing protein [Nitrospirota bacterium]